MDSLNLVAIIAGLVGTTVMLGLLEVLSLTHAVATDLPRTLGSILLRREKNTLLVGLVLHYTFGLCFGFIYTNMVVLADPSAKLGVVLMCLAMGVVHGIFSTLTLIGLAERHPSKKFREAPVPASLAHGFAHLAYGLAIGITLVALGGRVESL